MKTHYAPYTPANESDNSEYWGDTVCGLEYTESPMTNRWNEVTCKKCLKRKADYIANIEAAIRDGNFVSEG